MTAEIVIVNGVWADTQTIEDYIRTSVTRTTDPYVVASHIINRGEDLPTETRPQTIPKIVVVDADDEPVWWLDVAQALAVAARIRDCVQQILDGRPLRRPVTVDDELREMDQ